MPEENEGKNQTDNINVSSVLDSIFFHLGEKNALFDPIVEKMLLIALQGAIKCTL